MYAAGLSPQTVNSYFRRAATVVDLQNGGRDRDRTGDPLLANTESRVGWSEAG